MELIGCLIVILGYLIWQSITGEDGDD